MKFLIITLLGIGPLASAADSFPPMTQSLKTAIETAAGQRLKQDFNLDNFEDDGFSVHCDGLGHAISRVPYIQELGPGGSFECSSHLTNEGQAVCDDGVRDRNSELVRGNVSADGTISITLAGVREACSQDVVDANGHIVFHYGR